jgi:hypothetical protein
MSIEDNKKLHLGLAGGSRPEIKQYEPVYSGPPEKPEYYFLHFKKGKRYPAARSHMRTFLVEDKPRHAALSRLRKEYILATHPEITLTIEEMGDYAGIPGYSWLPEHMPTFDVYKKDNESLKIWPLSNLNILPFVYVWTVPPEWKEIIEALAPGECQFFPYEYRSRDGGVFYKRFIVIPLQRAVEQPHFHFCPFSPMKSGFLAERRINGPAVGKLFWYKGEAALLADQKTYRFDSLAWNGQLVVCRSDLQGRQFFLDCFKCFVSARLYEALKDHCGAYAAFYPVHIDEEC